MTAAAEKSPSEFSASGRRRLCLVCRAALHHPHTGRPRVLCRKRNCMREYFRRKKAEAREPGPERWNFLDRYEAMRLWDCRCSLCEACPADEFRPGTPLPICEDCSSRPLTPRAQHWLSNCKPGCPLPNPFAGAKGRLRVTEGTEQEPRIVELLSETTGCEVWRWLAGRGPKALFERVGPEGE